MAAPGLAQHRQIEEKLPALSRELRTALAAACAERVLPVLEDYYGERRDECRNALELAWRFALGEAPPETELRSAVEACEAMAEELYEDDEDGATLYALNAISYALQTTLQPETKPADESLSNASDAAHTGDTKRGKDHINEEADWQLLALDVALEAKAVSRDMFKHLPSPPQWLTDFYTSGRALSPPIP